jgi:PAS domain S-box-containing protein
MLDPFRILLIDDSSDDRVLIRRALEQEFKPLEVCEAGDAETLERALNAEPYDLVITDYNLGFTDGFTLLDALKARWPDCPVILCTGSLSEAIAVAALRKGLDDYVLKDQQRILRLPAAARSAVEHARQRAAARAAEVRYQALFEGAPVGLVQSLPDGRLLAANPAAARIWGYDVASYLRINSRELYTNPADQDRLMASLESAETLHNVEIHGRRADGTLAWVNASVRAVRDAGRRVLHYEWSLQDITERKELEAQLRQAQKMEAIGQLAGGVAHDFNNLLTVIGGRSSLLLQKLRPDDPARRDVDLIEKTAQRAAGLTRQLLAFSRKQILEPKPLDLNALVAGMTPMLKRLIGEHIEVVTVPGDSPGHVMADPGQVEQVIMNLVVHARDAMPDGGMVTIETAGRTVQEDALHAQGHVPPGRYVTLSVQDTGCGMDSLTLARIFEPFFTTKEPGKGTGLGFSTVHGIVHQSDGYIGVDSALGRGTTFTIYLRRIAEPVTATEVPNVSSRDLMRGTETVLLVEDEEEVRRLASEILKTCGYMVLETGDPLEALSIGARRNGAIDLLLTDMVMPAMPGSEVAQRLATTCPGLRVLYMSGYTDEMIAPAAANEPPRLLLRKPFTPDDLARKVREALARR